MKTMHRVFKLIIDKHDQEVESSSLVCTAEYSPDSRASCLHTCASVTKQYNFLLVDGQQCSNTRKVTVGH